MAPFCDSPDGVPPNTARPAKMDSSAPLGYTEKNRPGAGLEKTPMTAEPLTVDIWSDFV